MLKEDEREKREKKKDREKNLQKFKSLDIFEMGEIPADIVIPTVTSNSSQYDKQVRDKTSSRVIVLGAPGAGKTTFIELMKNTHRFPEGNLATDGIQVTPWNNFTFWDFGGQEVLFATHQFFLTENCQYVLVVNLAQLVHSDDKIRQECEQFTEYWMSEIYTWNEHHQPTNHSNSTHNQVDIPSKHAMLSNHRATEIQNKVKQSSVPVILIGTHCDELDNNYFSSTKATLKAFNKLLALAHKHKINYIDKVFRFSKKGNHKRMISTILNQIQINSETFIRPVFGFKRGSFTKKALNLAITKHNLENLRSTKQYLWWNEYCKVFGSDINMDEINEITKLLIYSGVILTFNNKNVTSTTKNNNYKNSIIILDPTWLANAFKTIISISFLQDSNKKGFFTRSQLESNWKDNHIHPDTWDELESIFIMFNMIIKLSDGKYYVPVMLHSSTLHSHKLEHNIEFNQAIKFLFNKSNFQCISREYYFNQRIPFGFIERVVIRILRFHNLNIHDCSITNNFFIYHELYSIYILITMDSIELNNQRSNSLKISIFYPLRNTTKEGEGGEVKEESDTTDTNRLQTKKPQNHNFLEKIFKDFTDFSNFFCFFSHFIFFVPHEIISYYITCKIIDVSIYDNNTLIGNENDLLLDFIHEDYRKYFISPFISIFDAEFSNAIYKKYVKASNLFEGSIEIDSHCFDVSFKESKTSDNNIDSIRQFIQEIMITEITKNKFTLSFYGICKPTMSLLDSRRKLITLSSDDNDEFDLLNKFCLVIEQPQWHNLTAFRKLVRKEDIHISTTLKLKFAYDISRALKFLHGSTGFQFVHRNIQANNVFICSIDHNSIKDENSIHAKLGDFECSAIETNFFYLNNNNDITSFKYCAPELLRGVHSIPSCSSHTDVYSFGILLWEILADKNPFSTTLKASTNPLKEIIAGKRPSLKSLPKDIPDRIVDLIQSCWNQDFVSRPSFTEIGTILQSVLKQK